eukprot:366567_1
MSSNSNEPEWNVPFPPFFPFIASMTAPVVAQFAYPPSRYSYFLNISNALKLPTITVANDYMSASNTFWRLLFGSAFTSIGFFFMSNSMKYMSHETTNKLATTGVWHWTRNPIYLGSIFMQFGVSLFADNGVIAGLIVPYFLWLQFYILPIEEKGLIKYFGQKYKDYMKQTKRWIIF